MKRAFFMVLGGLLIASIAGHSQDKGSGKTADADNAQRVATGRITKIDAKKQILTVVEGGKDSTPATRPANQGNTGTRGRRGGRAGRGGVSFPGGGGRTPVPASKDKSKEFKVTVTDKTAIRDSENKIPFNLLRVGDQISIQGLPKGKGADLNATQITVN